MMSGHTFHNLEDTGAEAQLRLWPWTILIEKAAVSATEWTAAGLLLAEILILIMGVALRYVFHAPLIWLDELASILLLWLVVLGAVIATARAEHMRMTALADRLSVPARALLSRAGTTATLAVLLLLLPASVSYTIEEHVVRTPALDIAGSWKAAALPTGIALMLLLALFQGARQHGKSGLLWAGAISIAFFGLALLFPHALAPLGRQNIVIFFYVVLLVSVLLAVPIAFAFGMATCGYMVFATPAPLLITVSRMGEGMSHIIFLSVPIFIFLGLLIEMTGMGRVMVRFLASLLGHIRGGLGYVLIGAMYLVSGISGSKAADMAAVAPVLFPELKARGYKPGEMAALLSATGAQTETIPPSLVLITIGSVAGVSITALFTSGLLPALVCGICLCIALAWQFRNIDLSQIERANRRVIWTSFVASVPALILPFLVRTFVVEGVATATEVSTIAIAYTVLIGLFVYREFDWRRVKPMLVDSAALSGAILLIVGFATAMGWGLTQSGFSHDLLETMTALPGGVMTFMAASVLLFVVLGSILEGIPVIVLFGPLLFPVARQLGVHEVHYAMVVVIAMGIGLFTPPFGVGFYTACAIARVSPKEAMRHIWLYSAALLLALLVIVLVPWLSTGFLKAR